LSPSDRLASFLETTLANGVKVVEKVITLHPQKFRCTPKNEGKRVHVPPDEKTCGQISIYKEFSG
jgi:hypothetical protein